MKRQSTARELRFYYPESASASVRGLVFAIAGLATFASIQSAAAQDDDVGGDVFELDAFVVTGVAVETAKIKTSVSISTVNTKEIEASAPRTTAEIFRSIPGIRSEATSGDGNANIAVRGLPIAAGGAKFLQLQEDGFPVLEFGDIAFITSDAFLRADYSIDRIEAVRGGSASTFASNSPGGLINFISKTGAVKGGAMGFSSGLDYDSLRYDFEYGQPIDQDLQYHVSGFYRSGEGPRDAGYDGNRGGQIKANVTKFFDGGHARFYFKRLDDRAIAYMPMPVSVTGTNSDPEIGNVPGFDAASDTPHSDYFSRNYGTDGDGNRRISDVHDGMRSSSTMLGTELQLKTAGDWRIVDRIRFADQDGRFLAPFPAQVDDAQTIADSIAGAGAQLSYATGPNAGQAIANPSTLNGNGQLMRIHLFDTELNDFGVFSNDLRVSKTFHMGDNGVSTLMFGYYKSRQKVDMDWLWNSYLMELKGDNAALIDVSDSNGVAYSDRGLYAYGTPFWGALHRSYDTVYDIDAPFVSFSLERGKLNLDLSARYDSGSADGSYAGSTTRANFDVDGDGSISMPEQSVTIVDTASASPVDYGWNYVSYSIGGNYAFTPDVGVFARVSRGGRANADRLLFGPNILPDGSLRDDDAAVDMVDQVEGGVKWRREDFAGGELGLFATLFMAKTEEQNYEATTQRFLDRDYEATGLELESVYEKGGFSLRLGLTWTDAEITADALNPSVVGNTPRRQADLAYQISPTYRTERWSVGATLIGTTDAYASDDNQLVMPGYSYLNGFASYNFSEKVSLLFSVNNLFDDFGLSESEEGSIPSNNIIRARGITARTSALTLRYAF